MLAPRYGIGNDSSGGRKQKPQPSKPERETEGVDWYFHVWFIVMDQRSFRYVVSCPSGLEYSHRLKYDMDTEGGLYYCLDWYRMYDMKNMISYKSS